jgi:hypothetical protein
MGGDARRISVLVDVGRDRRFASLIMTKASFPRYVLLTAILPEILEIPGVSLSPGRSMIVSLKWAGYLLALEV